MIIHLCIIIILVLSHLLAPTICPLCCVCVLFSCTGILVLGPPDSESVASVITSLSTHKVAHKVFSGKEVIVFSLLGRVV